MENLKLYMATYNVGTSTPEQNLNDLLNLSNEIKNVKLPDFYILSFQEVKAAPQNMLMDALSEDPWSYACREILRMKGYIKLKSIRLQGLILSIFTLKKHLLNIREIETEYTRTGLKGMWGNKGAVSMRFSIYGCSVCFVNAHLSAHDNQLDDRVDDYNTIVKDQKFHVPETSEIFFHDYIFWMGDLNFRLDEKFDLTPEEIERHIIKKDLKKLFENDQLRKVMKDKEAFSELTEKDPEFAPTFKFEVGGKDYDHKRKPAWCDRILYRVNSKNYENVELKVDQLSYSSHPQYTLSDHKPVTAEFIIKMPKSKLIMTDSRSLDEKVFSDYGECVVVFDNIGKWKQEEENMAYFRFTKEIEKTKEDWIGLFKENFSSLDDYVTYEYVSKCSTPVEDTSRQCPTPGKSYEKYELTFSELPNPCHGKYCLIYFSQTEDKVSSVLGISNLFPVHKDD